jgi:hypothetical protein
VFKKFGVLLFVLFMFSACGGREEDTAAPEDFFIGETDEAEPAEVYEPVAYEEEAEEEPEEELEEEEPEIYEEEIQPQDEYNEEFEEETETEETEEESNELTAAAVATHALGQILEIINIPQGQDGAFDIDINFETGTGSGEASEVQLTMDMNMKVIASGDRVETLTTAEFDMGVMAGLFGGVDLSVVNYTLMQDGEITESRLFVGGTEVSQATINTFGIDGMQMPGGLNAEEVLLEMLSQNLRISPERLENMDISIERTFDGSATVTIVGTQTELDFALGMLGINLGGVEFGDVKLVIEVYGNVPQRVSVEIFWQMPVAGQVADFFAVIRVEFYATGDAVRIILP